MNYSQRRRAENEVVFKQRNDAIKDVAKDVLENDDKVDLSLQLTCECSNEECRDIVELPLREYEKARRSTRDFIIKPGHEHEDIEQVVYRDGYLIVEKFEEPPATDGKLNKT